jgi:hypothetical protein
MIGRYLNELSVIRVCLETSTLCGVVPIKDTHELMTLTNLYFKFTSSSVT